MDHIVPALSGHSSQSFELQVHIIMRTRKTAQRCPFKPSLQFRLEFSRMLALDPFELLAEWITSLFF